MEANSQIYRTILVGEFAKRCERNPRYSLRSFAKAVKISAGTLSRIFNGKASLSFNQAEKISDQLALMPKLKKTFMRSVVEEQKTRGLKRQDPRIRQFKVEQYVHTLRNEEYSAISEWFYAAILELSYLKNFEATGAWVASRLGISQAQANIALSRLKEAGLLVQNSKGAWTKSAAQLTTLDKNKTEVALKKKQIAIREKAIEAIQTHALSTRKMTTLTMAIDPALLPEAFERIDEFNQSLCEFLESKSRKRVYVMEIGLFSLQPNTDGESK